MAPDQLQASLRMEHRGHLFKGRSSPRRHRIYLRSGTVEEYPPP